MTRPRIVVADDHEPMCELLIALVSATGLGEVVGTAADGREALDLVLTVSPDLALLDVEMPRMTGLAAAEVIATYCPGTRVILHTGADDPSILERARRLGIPLVSKIVDVGSLAAAFEDEASDAPSGEPTEIAAVVLAALERGREESVIVLDRGGSVVFYDSRAGDLLGLPFPSRPIPFEELCARLECTFPDSGPAGKRPILRVLAEREPVQDVMFNVRNSEIVAWASRAAPLADADGSFAAAAIYWTELRPAVRDRDPPAWPSIA
jgi:CheY-like chemotaxis protein